MFHAPARQTLTEEALAGEDLVRPFVSCENGHEPPAWLVGLVDRQRIVRNQVRQRISDAVQQRVETLLTEDGVEHLREPAVRLDERCVVGRRFGRLRYEPQR